MIPPLPHCQQKGRPDPPHRHHVEFVSTNKKHAQRGRNTFPHDLCDQRQAITACLHRRLAAIGEKVRMGDIMGRIIDSCQRVRFYVMTLYAPNVETVSMKMHFVAQRLENSAGRALAMGT